MQQDHQWNERADPWESALPQVQQRLHRRSESRQAKSCRCEYICWLLTRCLLFGLKSHFLLAAFWVLYLNWKPDPPTPLLSNSLQGLINKTPAASSGLQGPPRFVLWDSLLQTQCSSNTVPRVLASFSLLLFAHVSPPPGKPSSHLHTANLVRKIWFAGFPWTFLQMTKGRSLLLDYYITGTGVCDWFAVDKVSCWGKWLCLIRF